MSVDMRLDGDFLLVPQTNGDAALIADNDCFLQTLKLEAAASEGDLWYAPTWGWSLLDFKNALQDELTTLEIEQRVRQKLAEHEEIEVGSIAVTTDWSGDSVAIVLSFRLLSEDEIQRLKLIVGRTEIEVIPLA